MEILRTALSEFPVSEVGLFLPSWVDALPLGHPIRESLYEVVRESTRDMSRIRDIYTVADALETGEIILSARVKTSGWEPAPPKFPWSCPGTCITVPSASNPGSTSRRRGSYGPSHGDERNKE